MIDHSYLGWYFIVLIQTGIEFSFGGPVAMKAAWEAEALVHVLNCAVHHHILLVSCWFRLLGTLQWVKCVCVMLCLYSFVMLCLYSLLYSKVLVSCWCHVMLIFVCYTYTYAFVILILVLAALGRPATPEKFFIVTDCVRRCHYRSVRSVVLFVWNVLLAPHIRHWVLVKGPLVSVSD